ncbi:sugar ABC transporter permease [Mycoplasma miroungirhinis]|uniref:Sugar ABC transporter permease n=1 Tax=Mycoplasma miroungirhinis TaxID=754516 RepID=A0A6M4JDV0_9MOLU|nr:sugar ABC transporter permease [Mycoplasma miroungirhinis]QJR44257.1 sugar ABC transporter permease [Mycoplasma miroungirhinis]
MKNKIKKLNYKKILSSFLFLFPLLLAILLFTIIPIFKIIFESFVYFPNEDNLTIKAVGTHNYNDVFNDSAFNDAIKNSTIVLFLGTSISLILALFFSIIIESIISKISKTIFLSLLYSQFFLSSFSVGLSFTVLFGDKNLFFKFFNLDNTRFVGGQNPLPIWIYYTFFQIWRSLPFNIVLISSGIRRADNKYWKLIKSDKISLFQKIRFVYFNELSKNFFSIILTNFIFSSLILPEAILGSSYNYKFNHGHTLTSYILGYFDHSVGVITEYKPEKGYAASFLALLYLMFLIVLVFVLKPNNLKKEFLFFKKIFNKIKRKMNKNA